MRAVSDAVRVKQTQSAEVVLSPPLLLLLLHFYSAFHVGVVRVCSIDMGGIRAHA